MGKFGEAIGIWDLKIKGTEFELEPKLGDNKKLMRIMMNQAYKKDAAARFEAFDGFMRGLIERDNPDEPKEEIALFVEMNLNELFEEATVAFRWTTREELEKQKKELAGDIKKLIGDN